MGHTFLDVLIAAPGRIGSDVQSWAAATCGTRQFRTNVRLDESGRDSAAQGDDDLGEHLLTGGLGAAAVGGHNLLTDPPARLDFDIII